MSTRVVPLGAVIIRPRSRGALSFFRDTLLLTRRNLVLTIRTPELVIFAAVMPIMFVLLFRYVFGGAIPVPGYPNYIDYLMPGVIVPTALFGGPSSGGGVGGGPPQGGAPPPSSPPPN